ncbi:inositol monophosphatase 1-like [Amphiura filiformis]|uniref:inositol monophosphatase 1-like n=1 Tax=Amphiura filiformis TaxID=82378 RepID=UPI003B22510E
MADYTTEELKVYLETAVNIARTAGKEVQNKFYKKKRTEIKSSLGDPVTETDKLIEKMFVTTIKEKYPSHRFIGEESTAAGKRTSFTDNPTWIIDPIDGTTNFVHCLPYVCISIALVIKQQVVLGIVYNPMHDLMYTAIKGQGAFCNEDTIHVSGQEEIGRSLIHASATMSNCEIKLNNMKALLQAGAGLRYFGCVAEGLCHVANGSLDAYVDSGFHAWDVAAGALIVEEAGGILLDPTGGPFDLMCRRILVASSQNLASTITPLLTHIEYPKD